MAFNILSVSICKNGGKQEEEEEDDGDDERKRNTFPVVCKTDTDQVARFSQSITRNQQKEEEESKRHITEIKITLIHVTTSELCTIRNVFFPLLLALCAPFA